MSSKFRCLHSLLRVVRSPGVEQTVTVSLFLIGSFIRERERGGEQVRRARDD